MRLRIRRGVAARKRWAVPVSRSHLKDLELAAEWLGALVYDEPLRQQMIAGQRRRLANFSLDRLAPHLQSLLAAVA